MKFSKYVISIVFLLSFTVFAQKEVTKLNIEEIVVNKMSFVNSKGISWDRSGGPDIYLEIKDYRKNVIENTRNDKIQDITQTDLPLNIKLNKSTIYQLNAPFIIILKDADAFSDDIIESIEFTPTSFPNDTTQSINVFKYSDEKEITDLEIKYKWEE